jgi:hypothetical protein
MPEDEAPTEAELDAVQHSEPDDDSPVQGFNPEAEFSIVDAFREELRELTEAQSVFIPFKGYERIGLQAKYRMPENGREIANVAQKIMREFKDVYSRNLYVAMDTMILLCEGLYVQPEGVEEPVMLDPDDSGFPMAFDHRLTEMMGMNGEISSARQVLKRLFGNNEMAILAHSELLQRWMQNTKANLDTEVWELGE